MLSPGDVVAQKYRILALVGQGGFGNVYKAYDVGLEREVAIKELLHDTASSSPERWQHYRNRFRKEASLVKYTHQNIVATYALEEDDAGNLYLIQEYVDGGSLEALIEESAPLSVEEAISIALDLCQAVSFLYAQDVVHRDIKPSNVLLTTDRRAKLTDFGVAQVGHETRNTQAAQPHPGTPAYKSPEQANSTVYLDERSDLYAVGLVLYEMLTGQLYVRQRVPPILGNPDVPPALNSIALKALQEDRRRRYQNADAMARDLQLVLAQDTIGQIEIVVRNLNWRRGLQIAAVLALLGMVLILYGMGSDWTKNRTGSQSATPTDQISSEGVSEGQSEASVASQEEGLPKQEAEVLAEAESIPLAAVVAERGQPSSARESGAPAEATTAGSQSSSDAHGSDPYEDDADRPVEMAVGDTLVRAFDTEGDVDRISFRARRGRSYVVNTSNLATGVDTRIEAIVGDEVLSNDDVSPGTLASQVTFSATDDETVVVIIYNQDLYGPNRTYDVTVLMTGEEPSGTTATPSPRGTVRPTRTRPRTYTPRATFTLRPTWTTVPQIVGTPTPGRTRRPTSTRWPTWTRVPTWTRTPTKSDEPDDDDETPTPTATATVPPTATTPPDQDPTDEPDPPTPEPPTPVSSPLPVKPTGPAEE